MSHTSDAVRVGQAWKFPATIILRIVFLTTPFVSLQPASAEPLLINANAITVTSQRYPGFTARGSIDGSSPGWAIEPYPINQSPMTREQSVVWPLVSPLDPAGGALLLSFFLSFTNYVEPRNTLGQFRLSYTQAPNPNLTSSFTPMPDPFEMSSSDQRTRFIFVYPYIVVNDANPPQAIYKIRVELSGVHSVITGFRLDVPTSRPGRAHDGHFVLTHFSVETVRPYKTLP